MFNPMLCLDTFARCIKVAPISDIEEIKEFHEEKAETFLFLRFAVPHSMKRMDAFGKVMDGGVVIIGEGAWRGAVGSIVSLCQGSSRHPINHYVPSSESDRIFITIRLFAVPLVCESPTAVTHDDSITTSVQ
jgi:hypothetical protein